MATRQPRLYLADLGYFNDYNYSQPTPLNAAYVGIYAKKQFPELQIEIFKHPLELLDRVKESPPDLLGLSHYQWNSNLNNFVVKATRAENPNCRVVFGGPHFNAVDMEDVEDFMHGHSEVDFHVEMEGEATFSFILERLLQSNQLVGQGPVDWSRMEIDRWPKTLYGFDYDNRKVHCNPIGPFERLDLTTLPSPYLEGWMDKFLENKFLAPIIETNRGCPYSCSFCAWGTATQSKVRQFPFETVIEELNYVGPRTANPYKMLYLADANFGILKRDEDIAAEIAAIKERTEFPKQLYVYFAKNTNERVMRVAELTKSVTMMSMSKQSINDSVLENIRRKNIPHQQYDDLRAECERRGITTFSELIYGLPGETYDSFVDGVVTTVRQKAKVALYPLLLIQGAENFTQEQRKTFGFESKHRVLPRFISTMPGIPTLEYEEVAIANEALPFEDWLKIRQFHYLITLFASEVFTNLKRELEVHDLDYATLAKAVVADMDNWSEKLSKHLDDFKESSQNEFLDKGELKGTFDPDEFSDIELMYPALNYYYFSQLCTDRTLLDEFEGYLVGGLSRFFPDASEQQIKGLEVATEQVFREIICYDNFEARKTVTYRYNVDEWLQDEKGLSIIDFALEEPSEQTLVASPEVRDRYELLTGAGLRGVERTYKLRIGYIGFRGDKVFRYDRETSTLAESSKLLMTAEM